MDDEVWLDPAVRAAHGVATRRRRDGKPGLSLDRIVEAALALADEDGLTAVSMAKVAARLDSAPMSLYRHVASKDELLSHLQDAAPGVPPPELATIEDWRTGLRRWTEVQISRAIARPWCLDIPMSTPPLMPNSLAWMELAMRMLVGLPLAGSERLALLTMLTGQARSQASVVVNLRRSYAELGVGPEDEGPRYERGLLMLTAGGRFPILHEMTAGGEIFALPPGVAEEDADDYFWGFAIDRVLDGVASLIDSRRGTWGEGA